MPWFISILSRSGQRIIRGLDCHLQRQHNVDVRAAPFVSYLSAFDALCFAWYWT